MVCSVLDPLGNFMVALQLEKVNNGIAEVRLPSLVPGLLLWRVGGLASSPHLPLSSFGEQTRPPTRTLGRGFFWWDRLRI